jgi:hypothetical protein
MRPVSFALLLAPSLALAADPSFDFGKGEELKAVEWKVIAKGGLLLTSGNSQATSASLGLTLSRRDTWNKATLEGGFAYAQSNVIAGVDTNGNKVIDPGEDARVSQTTANNWLVKARYDRFFTLRNSGYVAAAIASDAVAGKDLYGGGQVGYSRQLYKSASAEYVGEVGYDYTAEKDINIPAVQIHSGRLFLGYSGTIGTGTTAYLSVEALFNLNPETAPNASDHSNRVGPFLDTRVVGKVGALSTFYKNCSIAIGFTLKYDNNPAPRPPLSLPYAQGYQPFADKLDTIIEAALVVNLI